VFVCELMSSAIIRFGTVVNYAGVISLIFVSNWALSLQ
jgi:hypothetical protein